MGERKRERACACGDMGCEGVDGKYIGKMEHDRAGPARHEGPVLPSGEREPVPDCARAKSDHEHLGRSPKSPESHTFIHKSFTTHQGGRRRPSTLQLDELEMCRRAGNTRKLMHA